MNATCALVLFGLFQAWPRPVPTLFGLPHHTELAPPAEATVVDSVPEIGNVMPCLPDPSRLTVISSAAMASGCEVLWNGIEFFVATEDLGSIGYISVNDYRFVTDEGVHVGTSVADVAALGGQWWKESGWGFHARLPSGWEAALAQGPTMTDGELPTYGSVQWLFRVVPWGSAQ